MAKRAKMKSPIRKVKKNTALNPVARAVAKTKLLQAVTSYRISLYLHEPNENAESDYRVIAVVIASTMGAMDGESVEYRKLKSGMSVCAQAALRGFTWHDQDAVTLDNALAVVLDVFPKLRPDKANKAIKAAIEALG